MNDLQIKKLLRALIPIKIMAIAAIIAYTNNLFYIGEKSLTAVEEPTTAKDASAISTSAGDPTTDAAAEPKRKSFLDGLLNLPDISDNDSKKEEIGRYLGLAERKKQQVDDRIGLLDSREQQLKRIEALIDEKLAKLEEERLFFTQTVQKEKIIQEDRLEKLVELYAKMEPKKAGPVFEALDKDLVVALFNKMEKKTVTRILEVVTPPRSVELTEYFGRIRSSKEYDLLKEMNVSLRGAFDECKGMTSPSEAPASAPEGAGAF